MRNLIRAFHLCALILAPGAANAGTAHIREYNFGFEKGNLVSNWTFENLGFNWESEASAISVDPRYQAASQCTGCRAVTGSFVGKVFGTYAGSGTLSHLTTQLFPVLPGQAYTLSFYYKTSSISGTVEPRVLLFDSPDSGGVTPSQTVTGSAYQSSPDWRLYSLNFTSDSASLYAKIALLYTSTSGEGGTLYFDDVVLEEGTLTSAAIAASRFQISETVSFGDALGRVHQTQTKISSGTNNPYPDWKFVKPLTLNTTSNPGGLNVSANVLNFPLLVRLSNANFNFAEAKGTGADIRFSKTNGDTLSYEIEKWDSAGATATVWVKLDTIYGDNAIQAFRMFWGNSGASSQSSSSSVFKGGNSGGANNYKGVWHLSDSAASATVTEALGLNNGTTKSNGSNSNTSNFSTSGLVGKALNLDGVDDDFTHGLSLPKSEGTISHWVKADQVRNMAVYYESNGTTASTYNGFGAGGTNILEVTTGINSAGTGWVIDYQDSTTLVEATGGTPITTDWVYLSLTWKRTDSLKLYVNGSRIAAANMAATAFSSKSATVKQVGRVGDGTALRHWDGKIDEVEVADVARDSNWVKLSYQTQKSGTSFLTAGATQSNLEAPTSPYPDWGHSRKAIVNTSSTGANISSTVTQFPLLIRLSAANFDFGEAKGNGSDIRFSRGTTTLPYEIEHWDSTGEAAEIWVKVDSVFGNNGTQEVTMYWGNTSASVVSSGSAVFDSANGFGGAWHLNESPGGGSHALLDRTQWGSNGTANGGMSVNDTITGLVGRGIHFDGTNDFVNLGDSLNMLRSVGAATLSAWVNFQASSQGVQQDIVSFSVSSAGPTFDSRANFVIENNKIAATGRSTDNEARVFVTTVDTVSLNAWHLVTAAIDYAHDSILVYVDGVKWSTTGTVNFSGATTPNTISRKNALGSEEDGTHNFFPGWLDEVVLSRLKRSPDWIKLSYETQKSGSAVVQWGASYPGWAYASQVFINTTSNGANVTNNVTKFPLLVRFNSGNFQFNQAKPNGEDIRFSKADGTPLSYEIEQWDTVSSTAAIWVKVDTVFGNNSSQYVNMHWGNSDAPTHSAPSVVFKSGTTSGGNSYKGVWHLNDNAANSNVTDALGTNTGTFKNGASSDNTSNHSTTGNIGRGLDLDGTDDFFTHGLQLPKTAGTISHWLKPDQVRTMVAYYESNGTTANYNGYGVPADVLEINLGIGSISTNWQLTYQDGSSEQNATSGTPSTSAWTHVAMTWNRSGSGILYVNGAQVASVVLSGVTFTSKTATVKQLGKVGDGTASRYWDGKIDELEVSDVARSADWLKLSYETQKSGSTVVLVGEFASNLAAANAPKYRVLHVKFDEFGRNKRTYLPVPVETDVPAYVADLPQKANAYYTMQLGRPEADSVPFSETLYPDSSQAIQNASPGQAWKMGGNHTSKSNYYYRGNLNVPANIENPATDSSENIYRFDWSRDADSNYSLSWTNRRSQIVQSASNLNRSSTSDASSWSWAFTQSQYFKAGKLKKTLTPLDVDSAYNKFVEISNFNSLGLPLATKTPGKGLIKAWFNRQGQVRFTQDEGQRTGSQYTFMDYDGRGRMFSTGIQTIPTMTQSLADLNSYSGGSSKTEHEGFIFDDLSTFQSRTGFVLDSVIQGLVSENAFNRLVCAYNFNDESTIPGFGALDKFVATFYSYDQRGNIVSTFKYVGPIHSKKRKKQEAAYLYDELDRTQSMTLYTAEGDIGLSNSRLYNYDEMRRIKSITGMQNKPICAYTYSDWGQISSQLLGGNGSGSTGLREDYLYHILGWIKETDAVQISTGKTIHQEFLGYEEKANGSPAVPSPFQSRFTGQITQRLYKYASDVNSLKPVRLFNYSYDELGRMKKADYEQNSNSTPLDGQEAIDFASLSFANVDSLDSYFDYDKNGRISGQRSGGVISLDSAKYVYKDSTYRLNKVTGKVVTSPTRNMNHTDNFQYDLRSSMTADSSKDLKIIYAWNMMPCKFILDHVSGADTAEYEFYDAMGNRVSRVLTSTISGSEKYFSARHYFPQWKELREGFNSSEILNDSEEIVTLVASGVVGRIRPNGIYEFYVKDHLGSTVRVVNDGGGFLSDTGSVYDYLAYGNVKTIKGNVEELTEKFTGKEYDEFNRLYNFGARWLDPELGAWLTSDIAGQYDNPYSSVGGDPINYSDNDGMVGVHVNGVGGEDQAGFRKRWCQENGEEYCGSTNNSGAPAEYWASNYSGWWGDAETGRPSGNKWTIDLPEAFLGFPNMFDNGPMVYRTLMKAHHEHPNEPIHVTAHSGGDASSGYAVFAFNMNTHYGGVADRETFAGADATGLGTGLSAMTGTRTHSHYYSYDPVSYYGAVNDFFNPLTLFTDPKHNLDVFNLDNWCSGGHSIHEGCRSYNDAIKDNPYVGGAYNLFVAHPTDIAVRTVGNGYYNYVNPSGHADRLYRILSSDEPWNNKLDALINYPVKGVVNATEDLLDAIGSSMPWN
ncbi:MAG: repeat-associated core protein [Fibrobacteres bacterium]|nr:repeat-associated core protein [Fibrobacterota bacterium]